MRTKLFLAAIVAMLTILPAKAQTATSASKVAQAVSLLTSENGISAGKALLALYTQYKTDGKLDLKNTANLSNIVALATNIKGLTSDTTQAAANTNFLTGLISGSSNLVNNNNSTSVLSSLAKVANLDISSVSSLASTAATAAATSAASGLFSKLKSSIGLSSESASTETTTSSTASTATSLLTSLFKTL